MDHSVCAGGNPPGGFHLLSGFSRLRVGDFLLFEVESPCGVSPFWSNSVVHSIESTFYTQPYRQDSFADYTDLSELAKSMQ